jgi:hypothetical protein
MFTLDQVITGPKLSEKNLVKVFFSMNNHPVATPEMTLEEARSYVLFCGESEGKVSAYIGIYFLLTGRRLFYAHSSNPFPLGEMSSVEDEALCFVEGLGALIDQIDISNLSAKEKSRWIEEQDIFSLQARPGKSPETPAPEPAETETVTKEPQEPQELHLSPAVPEVAPRPQRPSVQPEPQAEPERPTPEAAPAATQAQLQQVTETQAAPQPVPQAQPAPQAQSQPAQEALQAVALPQAAPTAPQPPAQPVEEAPTEREEESTSRSSAPQPAVVQDEAFEDHAVPVSAGVPELKDSPQAPQTEEGLPPQDKPVPALDRSRQKPPARDSGSKAPSSGASSTGKQDIMRKAIKAAVVRPLKPSIKKEAEAAGVVRRDREALARLLTSF